MEQRLSVVTLGATDLARSRRVYEQGLGWKRGGFGGDEIVFFQLGGAVLALYPQDALAEDATLAPEGSGFGGITLAYCARNRAEVEAVLAEAEAAGKASLAARRPFGSDIYQLQVLPADFVDSYAWKISMPCPPGWRDAGSFKITAYVLAQERDFPATPTIDDPCGLNIKMQPAT